MIIDQTKEISVDPLFERLPYITDTFTVEGELVNGLPIYTVSYAKTEKNTLDSIKNDFRSWLKEINVTVNESLVEYVPVEPNDNSKSLE